MNPAKSEVVPGHEPESGSSKASLSFALRKIDLLFAAFLLLLLFAVFFKTCFGSGSISRVCVIAEWDSIFDAFRSGKIQAYDPSLVQIFVPDYIFLAKNLC
ncbi:MAG: hypothetical protein K2X27_05715, partial [Candidatus Obscuribacterales bacterium]|nr:hypothetical protein [Candidatus Obscuribacterales bacterium]